MWHMIPSLAPFVQVLAPAFTQASYHTHCQLLLGWLMCLGSHQIFRLGQTLHADDPPPQNQRHPFDRYYNFFSRSGWSVSTLAYRVARLVVTCLNPTGALYLVIDDTLLHKRGKKVWGLGWFRDAVASTKKRVATASGNNWVVLGLAIPIPFCPSHIICLPLLASLHLPGKAQPSCVQLARQMLAEVYLWFPGRELILCGDGAYAGKALLGDLPTGVAFVGRLRGDAALFDPQPPAPTPGRRGPKPTKGARLDSPKAAAARADRQGTVGVPGGWQAVTVTAYGKSRLLWVLSYVVVWPVVTGLRPLQIVVVRDPEGKMDDTYLFTTVVEATTVWVIQTFARRWSIEVVFRSSKQVLDIEDPQQWCRESIEKMAPWVWLMQSVVTVWYLRAGYESPDAVAYRETMGEWESEWSLRQMVKVLQRAILDETIKPKSAEPTELLKLIEILKNYVNLAV
jgi:hypothetical protein